MPSPTHPCKHNTGCRKFGCGFAHPPGRPRDCRFGKDCTKQATTCQFLHPKAPSAGALALLGRGGGGGGGTKTVAKSISKVESDGSGIGITAVAVARQLCVNVLVDTSGSMIGSRITAALSGLSAIHSMLSPTDLYGVQTFASEVKNLHHPMPSGKVDWAVDQRNVRANLGGRTALWDSILFGIAELKTVLHRSTRQALPVFEQVVVTDGEDTSSKATFDAVRAAVERPRLPDYRLTIVGVALEGVATQALVDLCAGCPHARFLPCREVAELEALLRREAERIRISVAVSAPGGGTKRFTKEKTMGKGGIDSAIAEVAAAVFGKAPLGVAGSRPRHQRALPAPAKRSSTPRTPAAPIPRQDRFCRGCGQPHAPGAVYCAGCGGKF